MVEYWEWLLPNVLKDVPHRQWAFSLLKRLRIYFMYDPRLPAKFIIRACFSQERMVYIPVVKSTDGVAGVIYTSKNCRTRKTFDAVDWLAQLAMRLPDRYGQTASYYGFYSNKLRGLRKNRDEDDEKPTIIPGEMSPDEPVGVAKKYP